MAAPKPPSLRMNVKQPGAKSYIATDLLKRINEYNTKSAIISGALVIDAAHAYWWYVEFGAGMHFQGTAATQASGLIKPMGIAAIQGAGARYLIDRGGKTGTDKKGRRYIKRLRFLAGGHVIYRQIVMHPGGRAVNQGRGVVRIAVRQAHITLKAKNYNFKRRKNPPYRQELVDTLNVVLAEMLHDVQRLTPDGSRWSDLDKVGTPLRDAWTTRKAR